MPSLRLLSAVALTLATGTLAQDCPPPGTCQSFGVDFVDGGSYFQNVLSTDPFTAVEEFEGCQNDTANNIFVDPNGDQYQCTNVPLTPDDTLQTVTCPLDKDQLFSGEWSLVVISNNGDCDPIAYQRDFSLSVGPQATVSVPATITVSSLFTPIESDTATSTQTVTSTARALTTTVPRININPTLTIFPLPTITVVTKAVVTLTSTSQIPSVVATTTAMVTPTCDLPQRRHVKDPLAQIVITLLADLGIHHREAEPTAAPVARSPSLEFKRAIIEGRAVDPEIKAQYVRERHERLALQKRAPDQPTITVTGSLLPTSTISLVSTLPTLTVTGTTTLALTTVTTPVITVSRGIALSIATVTAARQTITNVFWVPATTVYKTTTEAVTLTITETSTPATLAASCSRVGGTLS